MKGKTCCVTGHRDLPQNEINKIKAALEHEIDACLLYTSQAQNRLPARKKLRMETVSDPETGKAKKHLKFEKEVKSQKAHVKGPVPLRPVKAGANTAIEMCIRDRLWLVQR